MIKMKGESRLVWKTMHMVKTRIQQTAAKSSPPSCTLLFCRVCKVIIMPEHLYSLIHTNFVKQLGDISTSNLFRPISNKK